MKVRALQTCFVGGILHKVGDVFDVKKGTALRTGKRDPVMERVKAGTPVGKAEAPPKTEPEIEDFGDVEDFDDEDDAPDPEDDDTA